MCAFTHKCEFKTTDEKMRLKNVIFIITEKK